MAKIKFPAAVNVFSKLLLKWNAAQNKREMPWKGEKDPYRIWLSEIILQQTRVEQGLAYYEQFIKTYPTVNRLAKAPDEAVFKLWEGLGYYSRCRNLLFSARYISKELKGRFPDTYDGIKALKGVGPYTAAAIASFAYNLPHAVVDGNVFRVLSRVFGLATPIDSTEGKRLFTNLANELLDKKHPGRYNQAIMDFGAVVCKPAAPLCTGCVFNKVCVAYRENKTNKLPVKEKKISIKNRWFNYLILEKADKSEIAIRQRSGKDIWQGLYEFPLVEAAGELSAEEVIRQGVGNKWFVQNSFELVSVSPLLKQQLSHQLIAGRILYVRISKKGKGDDGWTWIPKKQLKKYAFPRFINQYLQQAGKQGSLF